MKIQYTSTIDEKFDELIDLIKESFDVTTTKERIINLFSDPDIYNLIALVENKIVGYVQVKRKKDYLSDEMDYWLDYVCVKRKYRNQGIATAMLRKVEEMALEENISAIEFSSGYEKKDAHACYLKNGYKIRDSALFIKKIKEKDV